MSILIAGLILFLGMHSVRMAADGWRTARLATWGERGWKGLYTLVSLVGFALIIWGFGLARMQTIQLWSPPAWTKPVASVLVLIAFVLIAAAYVPGNRIRARLGHPMVAGVKTWALAHLLANGSLADVVLFGAFLAWAVLDFRSLRRRDREEGTKRGGGNVTGDALAVVAGLIAWLLFAYWLHGRLFGRPLLG